MMCSSIWPIPLAQAFYAIDSPWTAVVLTGAQRRNLGFAACSHPCSHLAAITQKKVEAPSGFEPEMEVLQTSALPLGDGAD
jgi:hypothetical protein